jgi:hypothetical protein
MFPIVLDETTVAEFTERAGVGKGTFFTYFPSKVAVLTGVASLHDCFTTSFQVVMRGLRP